MYIYYLYTRANPNPIRQYLALSGRAHAGALLPVTYESLVRKKIFGPGLYIFSDIEMLQTPLKEKVTEIYTTLTADPARYRVLNHPTRTLSRFPLLRTLHQQGLNHFNVYRATEELSALTFPVFLRRTDDHRGPQTSILKDHDTLKKTLEQLARHGEDLNQWLVTEFCDVRDSAGTYRKYSSFIVGKTIVPRHLFLGSDWVQKRPGPDLGPSQLEEERQFIEQNLFADQLSKIFALAQVDYGRIDFGVVDNRVQTWEINTNPMIITHGQLAPGPRQDVHTRFFKNFCAALNALIQKDATARPGLSYLPDQWNSAWGTFLERRRMTALGKLCERITWKWERLTRRN
ncbi:MAG: hypothetical protein K8I00_07500 [Candidatus Omnitrophica bacterium]|nr:hypothetical protein [Candidatus Omnitrophota bacterium]